MTFDRIRMVAAALLTALGCFAVECASAFDAYHFDLPEQSLAQSLRQIAQRASMNILFDAGSVEKLRAPAIKGTMSAEQAIEKALEGTSFVVRTVNRNSVLIAPARTDRVADASAVDAKRAARPAESPRETEGPAVVARLEEVTVTAQRREENSQTVPIAIDTISGLEAKLRGAISFQTLSATVSNLTSTGTFWSNTYIRGVGTNSASPNNEPSVATYVDGVYSPSSYALSSMFFTHVERIEVLKGPQGTLFGRNATGGVVQIITPDPQHELHGDLSLGYGSYETFRASTYLTGGVSDRLAADVAVSFEDQQEGWGYNPTYDTDIFMHENVAVRSKWLYSPSPSTEMRASFDYSKFQSDGANNQLLPGAFASDGVTTYPGRHNAVGEVNENLNRQYGLSLRIDHDFGAFQGVSISSYRNVSGRWHTDNDNTPNRWVVVDNYNDADYVTQEFHLSSQSSDRFEWLTGVFFYGTDIELNPQVSYGERVQPDGYNAAYGRQKTRSISGFGQARIALFTGTKLTLGLRYTEETLETDGRRINGAGQVFDGPFADEIEFDPWTWRVALDRQFTTNVLGYVSYNRGFKSGGFNLSSPGSAPFFPETLDAYEVGLKSELLDHRLRVNLAAFYYDYQNLQVAVVPGGGSQVFTNAAAAENYGLDVTIDFIASDALTLTMGLGLLEAKYLDYPNARGFTNRGEPVLIANARGQTLPHAPQVSGYASAHYRRSTAFGEVRAVASLSYHGRSYISPTERPVRPAYELLNCSVEWWSPSADPIGVRLWGRNLGNSYYPANLISSQGGWYGSYAAPRTFGVTLMKEF